MVHVYKKVIHNEETKIRNGLDALSAAQNKTATRDAWGVFLLGLRKTRELENRIKALEEDTE